ncbi:hypothetical protein ACROYT_G039958 [Oculina patagonica]
MADKEDLNFEEIHFSPIPSQTNIYGLTKIDRNEEGNKLFLASLSGRVVCLEYPRNSFVPTSREVPFTYIPESAEIVSIDAFNRPEPSKGLVVGISLILLKNSRSQQKQFLNIYSALESKAEFSLDSIAEGCQHLELDFVPFQLTHAEVFIKGRKEVVFLLCGSDERIHMFCERLPVFIRLSAQPRISAHLANRISAYVEDLQVRPPVPTKGARRVAELASLRFLRERIRLTQMAKGDAKKEADSTAQSITSALSTEDADRILEQIKINTQRVFNSTKVRQKQKFEKLVREKHAALSPADTPYVDKTNWVINLSSRSLSDAEIALLRKGLNFAVTPTNIPAKEIIASVESAVRQLNTEQADLVRRAVNNILQQAEPPEPNITKEMRDGLKSLKEDDSIMILPADKGRASVVLDTETYRTKMSTLIEHGPYQLLNKDPTDRPTRKLTEKLLTLKRSGDLSEAVYNKIRPRHKQPPRIYGLPKIHKADVPLRPIVSCVNTFAYDLSAYLANILSPLTGNSDFAVTN